jgi:hypothetical protein
MIGCDKARLSSALIVFAALVLAVGCSGGDDDLPREAVYGTVFLDGKPLPDGSISFMPPGGFTGGIPTGGGDTIKNGKFSISSETGLVPGTYNVSIYAPAPSAARTKPAQVGGGKATELPKQMIPAKYNTNTELKAEIKKGGGNDLRFTLLSK